MSSTHVLGLAKGVEVYVEGLSLNAWTGRDGAERTGLAVTALWRVEVLGQIGGRPGRSKARRERAEAVDAEEAPA